MNSKLAVVTGATSGIGKEIATQLAARGLHVILACRDERKGQATMGEIAGRTGSHNTSVMAVNTASFSSIRDFARALKARHDRLDVLVNNAGVNVHRRELSADGVEIVFATNVLGYHLLTRELLALLKSSAPSRVVNVASMFASDLDLDDLEFKRRPYKAMKAYAQSKACDRLLTWALARRLEGSGVTANAMAPGLIQTGLYRDTPLPLRLLLRWVGLFRGRNVEQGADTAVWLATSDEVQGLSGKFFELRKERPCQFRNHDDEERLWEVCDQMVDRQA